MIFEWLRRWYPRYVGWVSWIQHPFLLACRIYWGANFVQAGFGKLTHLSLYAERFANWHIPAPQFNAVMAGITECVCGGLLVLGAGSRIITLPLIVTMIVAYRTAHIDEVTNLYSFVTAPPFLFLMTCVVVLLFGPGALSVDYLLSRFLRVPGLESKSKHPPAVE
jgi:putative oxidoreductase